MPAQSPSELKVAYLMVSAPQPNVYVGGLMVTDGRGLPLEFRYTEPIQPTRLQQILYGQVLNSYIKREVILDTLLRNVESKFRCLLVEDEQLLDCPVKSYPVLRIAATKTAPIGPVGQSQTLSPDEILLQVTPEGNPLRVQGKSQEGETLDLLLELGTGMEIIEPLKRIEKALEIICQETGITTPR